MARIIYRQYRGLRKLLLETYAWRFIFNRAVEEEACGCCASRLVRGRAIEERHACQAAFKPRLVMRSAQLGVKKVQFHVF